MVFSKHSFHPSFEEVFPSTSFNVHHRCFTTMLLHGAAPDLSRFRYYGQPIQYYNRHGPQTFGLPYRQIAYLISDFEGNLSVKTNCTNLKKICENSSDFLVKKIRNGCVTIISFPEPTWTKAPDVQSWIQVLIFFNILQS